MASGSRHRLKAANSARFAEPVARVAPAPVSNGISFRALPRPSLDELRKICQHYELKGGGEYAPGGRAARYLFDLSNEVQDLLPYLEREQNARKKRVKELERVVREWDEVFGSPSDLDRHFADGTVVSPASVHARIVALGDENDALRARVAELEDAAVEREARVEAALDERDAIAAMREERLNKEHGDALAAAEAQHGETLARLEEAFAMACRELVEENDVDVAAIVGVYEGEISSMHDVNVALDLENADLLALMISELVAAVGDDIGERMQIEHLQRRRAAMTPIVPLEDRLAGLRRRAEGRIGRTGLVATASATADAADALEAAAGGRAGVPSGGSYADRMPTHTAIVAQLSESQRRLEETRVENEALRQDMQRLRASGEARDARARAVEIDEVATSLANMRVAGATPVVSQTFGATGPRGGAGGGTAWSVERHTPRRSRRPVGDGNGGMAGGSPFAAGKVRTIRHQNHRPI